MSKSIIPVVFATDEHYLMPTYVAICSLSQTASPETLYDIHIMVPDSVRKEEMRAFEDLREKTCVANIQFINMGSAFDNVKLTIEHITKPTFYRIHIPNILRNYDKCIYLDSDLIVCNDLKELYSTNMDNYYIAGVKAAAYHMEPNGNRSLCEKLNIPSIKTYVNAGVLVMNLKKMRENDLTTAMLSLVDKEFPSQDQDIFNKVCYGFIRILPPKYNVMTRYLVFDKDSPNSLPEYKIFGKSNVDEARENPYIIHYATKAKPWKDKSILFSERWWNVVNSLPEDYKRKNIIEPRDKANNAVVSVYGSTATSHVVTYSKNISIRKFVGRFSVLSAFGYPLELEEENFSGLDDWSKKMIKGDLEKTSLTDLLSVKTDYIILDTHECRFDLVEIESNGKKTIVTDSYLLRKFLRNNDKIKVIRKIKVSDLSDEDLYTSVELFAKAVLEKFEPEQIILNEVLETEYMQTKTGEIVRFPNIEEIRQHNLNSSRIFDLFKKLFRGSRQICMPDYVWSESERSAPDYFMQDYFVQKNEALNNILVTGGDCGKDSIWYNKYSAMNKKTFESLSTPPSEKKKPLISIIVPIFNSEKTLGECLDSVMKQTYGNIEIICVDDKSTDSSRDMLDDFQKRDSRIHVIKSEVNVGSSYARKIGVTSSTGDYLMFLDSDDYYSENACEFALRSIEARGVDIVGFDANIINVGQPNYRVEWMTKFTKPKLGFSEGGEIFADAFINEVGNHLLWNKIFKRDLCTLAFKEISDRNHSKGSDRYAYFFLALFAKTYYGIPEKLYNYRLGTGVSNVMELSRKLYLTYLSELKICDDMKNYLYDKNYGGEYKRAVFNIRNGIIKNLCKDWYLFLSINDKKDCFDELVTHVNPMELTQGLLSVKDVKSSSIAKNIKGAKSLNVRIDKIKTIGIFYYRMSNGGVERVVSKLIPGYIKMGFEVILIVEGLDENLDYEIPSNLKVELIPPSKNIKPDEYMAHAEGLAYVLNKHNIDVLLYQASSSPYLFYDMLITKIKGRSFVVSVHELFTQPMVLGNTDFIEKIDTFRIADCVHVLNNMEEYMWNSLGVMTRYIRNPLTFDPYKSERLISEDKTVLWVGRFDDYQKCFTNAINTFELIHRAEPDVKFCMAGKGVSNEVDDRVRLYAIEKGLEKSIILPGYTNDISKFYAKSTLLLCTSAYETYPMVFGEAMSFGIPIVTFEMPYLEILKGDVGCISVRQKDEEALANAALMVLRDGGLRAEMSAKNQKAIKNIAEEPLFEKWQDLFETLPRMNNDLDTNVDFENFLRTCLFHYTLSINKKTPSKKNIPKITDADSSVETFDIIRFGLKKIRKIGLKKTLLQVYNLLKNRVHGN